MIDKGAAEQDSRSLVLPRNDRGIGFVISSDSEKPFCTGQGFLGR